jgi:hypothetical protein
MQLALCCVTSPHSQETCHVTATYCCVTSRRARCIVTARPRTKKTLFLYCWPRVLRVVSSNGSTRHIMLQPTVSRGDKPQSGAQYQNFISQTAAGLLMWVALSDKRTGLSFTTPSGPHQHSHSRVQIPQDS